ncbi:hypothetical protein, partial [Croceitalea rosinachiae]
VECSSLASFIDLRPSDFGFLNNSKDLNITDFDISSKFNLPAGSLLVTVTNAMVSNLGAFIIDDNNPVQFDFSGSVFVQIQASHSRGLLTNSSDGIVALDNARYVFVSDLRNGIVAENMGNLYSVNSSSGSNGEDFIWESISFASRIEFFTTSTSSQNGIEIRIAHSI